METLELERTNEGKTTEILTTMKRADKWVSTEKEIDGREIKCQWLSYTYTIKNENLNTVFDSPYSITLFNHMSDKVNNTSKSNNRR